MEDVRYFVRVTPANYLYALLLTFSHPVAVWKVRVPERLARRFQRVRPYRVLTRDEWLAAHDAAFERWKRAFPALSRKHRAGADVGGASVDFSRNLWQMLGIEFEALSLLASMLAKAHAGGTPCVVEPRIARAFEDAELETLFPEIRIARSAANRRLESFHEWCISAAHLARTLFQAAASFFRRRLEVGRRPVAWLGISPVEVPDRDLRLNFAWASLYGFLAPHDVLYFVPARLGPAQRAYLDGRGIETVAPGQTFAPLSARDTLAVAARSTAGFFAALRLDATAASYVARFMARAPYWHRLFKALGTQAYVTTTSYAWPEKAEVAVAAADGVRSIAWAYSANSLTFAVADPHVRDTGVVRSVVVSDECWVWNQAYAGWIERRQVDPALAPGIRVVGPLMCGDPRLLELDARAARARLGASPEAFCIGVFDMPPVSDVYRERFGAGPPMVDTETYVAFWTLIERIVERVPGSVALVKMKRSFGHLYREFPPMVKALLDEEGECVRSGRVVMLDVNVDPYLPIAASDIALGIPYTSPILAARGIGRPAYYLDPLAQTGCPPSRDYDALTLRSEDEAIAAVLEARRGTAILPRADSAIPPAPAFPLGLAR